MNGVSGRIGRIGSAPIGVGTRTDSATRRRSRSLSHFQGIGSPNDQTGSSLRLLVPPTAGSTGVRCWAGAGPAGSWGGAPESWTRLGQQRVPRGPGWAGIAASRGWGPMCTDAVPSRRAPSIIPAQSARTLRGQMMEAPQALRVYATDLDRLFDGTAGLLVVAAVTETTPTQVGSEFPKPSLKGREAQGT